MNDFISISINLDSVEKLIHNPLLTFTTRVDLGTGEVQPNSNSIIRFAKYKYLNLIISTDKLTDKSILFLKGSIHKFHSEGSNNTDFDLNAFRMATNVLSFEIGVDLRLAQVHCLEFGVNIHIPVITNGFIKNIIAYEGKQPILTNYVGNGLMCEFKNSHHIIKIYDKGVQPALNGLASDKLLRYEIRTKRMNYLRKKNISVFTLEDLTNEVIWEKLKNLLLSTFKKIVIFDNEINSKSLKQKDKIFFLETSNPRYWENLRKSNKEKIYPRTLSKFNRLVRKYSKDDIRLKVIQIMNDKLDELIKSVRKIHTEIKSDLSECYTYISCNNQTIKRRFCKVTGLEITHQSEQSDHVSEKTIELYEVKAPEIFCRLLIQFGGGKYDDRCIERIAKSIRCQLSYKRRNLKRRVVRALANSPLFNANEVLTLSKIPIELYQIDQLKTDPKCR